jgi:hypothetical protein
MIKTSQMVLVDSNVFLPEQHASGEQIWTAILEQVRMLFLLVENVYALEGFQTQIYLLELYARPAMRSELLDKAWHTVLPVLTLMLQRSLGFEAAIKSTTTQVLRGCRASLD